LTLRAKKGEFMASTEKYGWVNALRGYAILLVILIHSSQQLSVSKTMQLLTHTGDVGVQLFFIMSSFTLFLSYSKRKERETLYVKRAFFIRRFFRIAPYYYLAGMIYIIFALVTVKKVNVLYLIANYTFTNGIIIPAINYIPPGGWSVGVEMLFYLTIPFLYKYVDTLKKAIITLVIAIVLSNGINLFAYYLIENYTKYDWIAIRGWYLYFWLPNQFPLFIYGIILFFIFKKNNIGRKTGLVLLLSSIVLLILLMFYPFSNSYPNYFFQREYVYGFVFLLFALGLYFSQSKILTNKVIQKIGIVSFSMYLNHFIILYGFGYVIRKIIKNITFLNHINSDFVFIGFYCFTVCIAYILSNITYRIVELNGIKLGDYLIQKYLKKEI